MTLVLFVFLVCNVHLLYGGTKQDHIQILDSVTPVDVEEIPYTAVVFCNINKYFCSGTILHADWLLISAHCLYNMDGEYTEHENSITVVAGTNKVNFSVEDVNSGKVQVRQSRKIHIHNNYYWLENFINDLALIKVKEPFNMTNTVGVAPSMIHSVPKITVRRDDNAVEAANMDASPFLCRGFGYGKVIRDKDSNNDFILKEQHCEVSKHCHCLERIRSKKYAFNVLKRRNIFICDEVSSHTGMCSGDFSGQLVCGGQGTMTKSDDDKIGLRQSRTATKLDTDKAGHISNSPSLSGACSDKAGHSYL